MADNEFDRPHPAHAAPQAPREAGAFGRVVDRCATAFSFFFVASMSILIFEIFMRYALGAPTIWAHEATIFLCGSGFVFGGLYCAVHDRHIRVVLIYDGLSKRRRRHVDVAIYCACAAACAFFSYAAWLVVERAVFTPTGAFHLETSGSAWNPPTPALLKIFLFVALCALTLQFLIFAVNHLRRGACDD